MNSYGVMEDCCLLPFHCHSECFVSVLWVKVGGLGGWQSLKMELAAFRDGYDCFCSGGVRDHWCEA